MTESWSIRGGLMGALVGLAIAAVVLVVQYQTPVLQPSGAISTSTENLNPSQPQGPTGMNAPPPSGGSAGYGGYGVYAPVVFRLTDLQLELGQVEAAAETISNAPPDEILDYLRMYRSRRAPTSFAPAPTSFGPAPRFPPIMPDNLSLPVPGSANDVPNANVAAPDFVVKVLDRLRQRLLLPPPPTLGISDAPRTTPREEREKAGQLVSIAELYLSADERERAQEVLSHVPLDTISTPEASGSAGMQLGLLGSVPTSQAFSEQPSATAPSSPDPKPSWAWMFTAVTTVVGTVLGGVFKPVLEAYGKGVVGRAFAEAIQSKEFAAALDVKLSPPKTVVIERSSRASADLR